MYNNWAAINMHKISGHWIKVTLNKCVCVKQPLSTSDTFITVSTNYSSISDVVRSLSLENISPFGYPILI